MLNISASPVQGMLSTPGPKYQIMDMVPPLTVRMQASFRMTSLGLVQPLSSPVSLTPITLGHLSSHGMSAITSTASAPPTPMQRPPSPPPFGVCESVPTYFISPLATKLSSYALFFCPTLLGRVLACRVWKSMSLADTKRPSSAAASSSSWQALLDVCICRILLTRNHINEL